MKRIRVLLASLTALVLLSLAINTQAIKAAFPTFIPSSSLVLGDMADVTPQDEQKGRTLPEETLTANEADDGSAWSVIEASASQLSRAVAFRLVLEGQGEVTIDLQLMQSSNVIITEQIRQRFDGNGPHTLTHDIGIPHRLGDLTLEWQLSDTRGFQSPLNSLSVDWPVANPPRTKKAPVDAEVTGFDTAKAPWSVVGAEATQAERAVTFRLVLEGQGEVTIDLQLMRSGNVIATEQLRQRFDSNGPHTVTHDIGIPHRLGDLSLKWQLVDKEGTPQSPIKSIAVK